MVDIAPRPDLYYMSYVYPSFKKVNKSRFELYILPSKTNGVLLMMKKRETYQVVIAYGEQCQIRDL